MYSVEEEEPRQKSEERTEEEATHPEEGGQGSPGEKPQDRDVEIGKKDEISETTEYDSHYSTDDESLRMIFSSTDQSNCCSGLVFISPWGQWSSKYIRSDIFRAYQLGVSPITSIRFPLIKCVNILQYPLVP